MEVVAKLEKITLQDRADLPEYVNHRIQMFDKLLLAYNQQVACTCSWFSVT